MTTPNSAEEEIVVSASNDDAGGGDEEVIVGEITPETELALDPGQFEGEPEKKAEALKKAAEGADDEDGEHFPPANSKRWKQVIAEKNEAVKAMKEGLENSAAVKEMRNTVHKLIEENRRLAENAGKPATPTIDETALIDGEIARLTERRKELRSKEDFDEYDRVTDQIAQLNTKKVVAEFKKSEAPKVEPKVEPSAAMVDPEVKAALEKFQANAKWYGQDMLMSKEAEEYDVYLSQKPEWAAKPVAERYEQVRVDIERKYGYGKKTPSEGFSNVSGVESGEEEHGHTGRPKVKLTKAQMLAADNMDMTYEEYAAIASRLGD